MNLEDPICGIKKYEHFKMKSECTWVIIISSNLFHQDSLSINNDNHTDLNQVV